MRTKVALLAIVAGLATTASMLALRPAMEPLRSDGYFRGPTTYATQDAFTLSAGRTATKPTGMIVLGTDSNKPRFLEFLPYGEGSAATTFDYKLWAVTVTYNDTGGIDDYCLQLFCSGTATLSSTAGVAVYGVTSADKLCDTLSVTTAAYGTAITNAFGGVAPLVFTGSAGATLFVPETGNVHGFVLETDRTGASAAKYLYRFGV